MLDIVTLSSNIGLMRIPKLTQITILLSFILLAIIPTAFSFENEESLKRRINFYSKIQQYSNNTISLGQDPEKGLFCVANDYIENGSMTLLVPKRLSICPYYIFPFKHEIINALTKIPGLSETLGHEQRFSVYVLCYYIMYLKTAPMKQVKDYIKKHNLVDYSELTEIDESIIDTFPEYTLSIGSFEPEHYMLMKQLNYPIEKDQELQMVFKLVMQDLSSSPHFEVIYSWTTDFELFKWAYAIVMSRGLSLRLNEYHVLDEIKISDPSTPPHIKKNIQKNAYIGKTVGCPCVIAFIDLCNHHQPQSVYSTDRLPIILDTKPGYFFNNAVADWTPGDEIVYTYSNEPSNILLMSHYGFNIKNNLFNEQRISIEDEYSMSLEQFNLCRELGCFDPKIKSVSHIPKTRFDSINLNSLNEKLLNYARVKYFKGKVDDKTALKKLAVDKKISHLNEISANLFYFRVLKDNLNQESKSIENSIKEGQVVKERLAEIQQNWNKLDEAEIIWRKLKISANIFEMDLSYKKIFYKHAHVILNRILNENYNDVSKLRAKYIDSKSN